MTRKRIVGGLRFKDGNASGWYITRGLHGDDGGFRYLKRTGHHYGRSLYLRHMVMSYGHAASARFPGGSNAVAYFTLDAFEEPTWDE